MSQLAQSLEEVVDRVDRDVLAVREMDPFKGGRSFDERVDRVVGEIGDPDETDPTELGQLGELEDGHVGQLGTA